MASFNSQRKIKLWLAGAKRRKIGNSRKRKAQLLSNLSILLIILVFGGTITAFATIFLVSRKLPSPTKLTEREVSQSTKIFARNGDLLYEVFGDQRRTLVTLDDIPDYLKNATIAVEDAEFYQHKGFYLLGWVRAIYNMARGRGLQGASTISQQLVKNTLLTPERTISRKIKEFVLALEIERRYGKDEILQMYLNEAPYGGQAWGVGAASEMYFGKHVRDLDLAESALLAGLPQSPTRYSPWGSEPENAKNRQSYVLHLMVKAGFLTSEQSDEAKAEELYFLPPGQNIKAPHFVMYVKQKLVDTFGEKMVEQGGLRVWTTLDLGKQVIAEEEVKFQLDRLKKANANASNAGLIAINPQTGEIL
ncbi:MAG: transglycosylase domain-containing protein, partial [Candidatus Cloacimonetes bacterium]|nr:transglycosylase domain-containing protein [Candidatus Cloacimonadota bacterium]